MGCRGKKRVNVIITEDKEKEGARVLLCCVGFLKQLVLLEQTETAHGFVFG